MNAHKSGFISIIGNPNAGKSTLMNALIDAPASIISPKVQTTRHRILGIVSGEEYQMVFSDTPGIIDPKYKMQESMMTFVKESLKDADILIYLIAIDDTKIGDEKYNQKIKGHQVPLFILINKVDLSSQEEVEKAVLHWQNEYPNAKVFPISAKMDFYVKETKEALINELPEGEAYFPKDIYTDKSERFLVSEIIRKKMLFQFKKEIPYSVEINVEEFKHTEERIEIRAFIITERNSQKGIIIGHKGNALKKLGTAARGELIKVFDKNIRLELRVKTLKNWRNNDNYLKRFGYNAK